MRKPSCLRRLVSSRRVLDSMIRAALTKGMLTDPKVFEEARAGIPVTTQRRFDVYPDVSKGL